MMEKVYEVQGMKCDGCVENVTERFQKVAGVTTVKVSLADKTATVTGTASKEDLAASLTGTHFQLG